MDNLELGMRRTETIVLLVACVVIGGSLAISLAIGVTLGATLGLLLCFVVGVLAARRLWALERK